MNPPFTPISSRGAPFRPEEINSICAGPEKKSSARTFKRLIGYRWFRMLSPNFRGYTLCILDIFWPFNPDPILFQSWSQSLNKGILIMIFFLYNYAHFWIITVYLMAFRERDYKKKRLKLNNSLWSFRNHIRIFLRGRIRIRIWMIRTRNTVSSWPSSFLWQTFFMLKKNYDYNLFQNMRLFVRWPSRSKHVGISESRVPDVSS